MFIYSKKTSFANIQIEIERELGTQEAHNLKTVLDNIADGELPFYGLNEMNLTRSMVNAAIGTNKDVNYTDAGIQYSDVKRQSRLHFDTVNLSIKAMAIVRNHLHCGLFEAQKIVYGKEDYISDEESVNTLLISLYESGVHGFIVTAIKE